MNATAKRFVPGETYFIVIFDGDQVMVPIVQTLIFERSGAYENGQTYHLFREVRLNADAETLVLSGEQADHLVFDRTGLLTRLKRCFDGADSAALPRPS